VAIGVGNLPTNPRHSLLSGSTCDLCDAMHAHAMVDLHVFLVVYLIEVCRGVD